MIKVTLVGAPVGPVPTQIAWLVAAVRQIEAGSQQNDIVLLANSYTVTGSFTPTRSLDVSTATLPDVIALLATLISDLQKGGIHRAQ